VEARKEELWEGRVEAVLAALRGEEGDQEEQTEASEVHYFETHQERMRYAQFRAQGYPIGSGTVESACKRVIGARLKQAGPPQADWTKAGAQAVLSLRAALLSGRWDTIWPATRPQLKAA
jgi:hypothetical protein